jgi:hypothetical protein
MNFGIIKEMKNWDVTVRGVDGKTEVIIISAETRNDVFAELKKLGKNAIRIEESLGKKPRKAKKSAASVKGRGLVAAAIVVLGAALVMWWMTQGEEKKVEEKADKKERVVNEKKVEKRPTVVVKKDEGVKGDSKIDEALANIGNLEKPKIKVRELSPEEWLRITNRVFKTGTEQLMSIVFSTEPGDMPMPIPPISDEDKQNIISILISKNPINESDSEKIKLCKENVALAKKEMVEYLKEGGDPDDFLRYYFQELKSAFELRNAAVDQIRETWEGDPELGRQFLEKVNEKFANEGIKSINSEEFE